ncbi:hypothetical protein C3L33_22862, partial [Rhododendron williamsianum]
MVQSCIAMAKTVGAPDDSSLTPFEALAGLFWVCVSKIKGEGNGTLTNMSISLDMRETLGLDKGFFGNCMVYHKVPAWECLGDENGLSEATFVIGEAMKKMENQRILDLIERESIILPSPPGEGGFGRVTIWFKLCEDALLLQFNPTILMGIGKSQNIV